MVAVALALYLALGAAPEAPPSGEVSVKARLAGAAGEPLDGGELLLGDRAVFEIEVEAPADARVFVPANPALNPFRLDGEPSMERKEAPPRATEVHRFPVRPLRIGPRGIPPIEVTWQRPDGSSGTATTERIRVRVRGRLENETDPRLGTPPGPVPVLATNHVLVWSVSTAGAFLLATLLTWLVLRLLRRRLEAARPPPPPRPANEVALERLAALEAADLEPALRFAETVDVLRGYLGGRYGFDSLELTTRELMANLDGADLGPVTPYEVRDLLEQADLVKFARFEPRDDEARALAPAVRRVVEATWKPLAEEPAAAEAPEKPPEPASRAERLRAAAIDLGLALALGFLTLGLLYATGRLAWGALALLATGLALLLRDVAGPGSPGKAVLGLRVVRNGPGGAAGPPPSAGARVLRNLLLLVPPIGLPTESLVLLYHPLAKRLGDLWAGTAVVRGGRP